MLETTDNQQNKIGYFFLPTTKLKEIKSLSGSNSNEDSTCESNEVFYKFPNANPTSDETNITWSWTIKNNRKSSSQQSVNFR